MPEKQLHLPYIGPHPLSQTSPQPRQATGNPGWLISGNISGIFFSQPAAEVHIHKIFDQGAAAVHVVTGHSPFFEKSAQLSKRRYTAAVHPVCRHRITPDTGYVQDLLFKRYDIRSSSRFLLPPREGKVLPEEENIIGAHYKGDIHPEGGNIDNSRERGANGFGEKSPAQGKVLGITDIFFFAGNTEKQRMADNRKQADHLIQVIDTLEISLRAPELHAHRKIRNNVFRLQGAQRAARGNDVEPVPVGGDQLQRMVQ